MKKLITTLFLVLVSVNLLAHTLGGGVVQHINKSNIGFANIVILTTDSVFVSGTISDDQGVFEISNIVSDKYILKCSAMGYLTYYKELNIESNIDLAIELNEDVNLLPEVVVMGQKKLIESTRRGIIANVGTTSLRKLGTSEDVIKRLPGVFFEKENISVLGKGEPIVYVNNRKLNSLDELTSLQSENISTIELIMNPGVEYAADGKAVIIIKTKQKLEGLSVSFFTDWTQRKYAETNDIFNINFTKDKLTLYAGYNYKYIKRFSEEYRKDYSVYQSIVQDYKSSADYTYSRKSNLVTFGSDWNISEKQILGVQYQGTFNKGNSTMVSERSLYLNNDQKEISSAKNILEDTPEQNIVYLYHTGKWSKKYKTNIDFQYLRNTYKRTQDVFEEVNNNANTINALNKNEYTIYSVKQNNYVVLNDNNNLNFGGEYNYVSSKNNLFSGQSIIELEKFKNNETRWAGFVNYTTKISKFELEIGIRYEFENLVSDSIKVEVLNRKTNYLFPNISLSTDIDDWSLALFGSARIQRASFSQLNGNFIYINEYTIQKGNPLLKNIDIYELALQAKYKKIYAYLEYSYQKNPIGFSVYQTLGNNDYIYSIYSHQNFSKAQELSLVLNYNDEIGFWNPNYIVQVSQPFFETEFMGNMKSYNVTGIKVNMFNDFNFLKNYIFSANIYYSSPNYSQLTYKTTSSSVAFEFGAKASFFKDKVRVNLKTYDPFNMTKKRQFVRPLYNSALRGEDVNKLGYVSLSLTYKFNNYTNKYKRVNSSGIDRL